MEQTVWDRIAAELVARGKTQDWLADQLGIKPGAVANWKARRVVPPGQYAALAVLFGESIDWVAGTSDQRRPAPAALSPMALRLAQEFDRITDPDKQLDAFARCLSAVTRAADAGPAPS